MNSRERLLAALDHREPDRLPFDLGSTQVTGIHALAYQNLRTYLGFKATEINFCDQIQQLALPDEDVIERLGVDVRGLFPLNSHNWNVHNLDVGDTWEYTDEWGITHRRQKPVGLYYSAIRILSARCLSTPRLFAITPGLTPVISGASPGCTSRRWNIVPEARLWY